MEQIINLDFFFRPISRRVHFTNLCFKDLCNDSSLDIKETIQNTSLSMEAFLVKKKKKKNGFKQSQGDNYWVWFLHDFMF